MITSWDARAPRAAAGALLLAFMTTADIYSTATDLPPKAAPTIRPTQREIILQSGDNFTLYCSGTSQIQFKHQNMFVGDSWSYFFIKKRIIKDDESGYEVALDLVDVFSYAVGYYACFDDSVDAPDVLAAIVEEPHDTPHITYIYVYVNETSMLPPVRPYVIPKGNKSLIECKPTSPDIVVSLTVPDSSEKLNYEKFSPKIGFTFAEVPDSPKYRCDARRGVFNTSVTILNIEPPATPQLFGGSTYFLKGETFSVNCTVKKQRNYNTILRLLIPDPFGKVQHFRGEDDDVLYNNITIRYADMCDEGLYECFYDGVQETKRAKFMKTYLEKPIIEMDKSTVRLHKIEKKPNDMLRLVVDVTAYPPAEITVLKDGASLPKHFNVSLKTFTDKMRVKLILENLRVNDTGKYTVKATNQYNMTKNCTFDLTVSAAPSVNFGPLNKCLSSSVPLLCEATGYPLPNIEWIFTTKEETYYLMGNVSVESLYKIKSDYNMRVHVSGNITCKASNQNNESDAVTNELILYEIEDGFGIMKDRTSFFNDQDAEIKCFASILDFSFATWYGPDLRRMTDVEYMESDCSHVAKLKFHPFSTSQAGRYTCFGYSLDGSEARNDTITITVAETRSPVIEDMIEDGRSEEILPFHPVNFTCTANAIPPPSVEWFKDGEPVQNDTNVEVFFKHISNFTRYSIIKILRMQEDNAGKYECRVTSHGVTESKYFNLLMKEYIKEKTSNQTYLSIIGAIFLVLMIIVPYLAWKIRKEKEYKKELAAAGLQYFMEGVVNSINPNIGIEEQAELLPYDENFEFPAECLKLGEQLGAGAFGVVYKAEARGIMRGTSTVAVKMVKKTADNMYIKALATELKIMIHLGKHLNVVNLLGACTKNVGKRELMVIVEYCKFDNIQNYMQKHRDVFIDQLNDNPEKHNMRKYNWGYLSSSGNRTMYSDHRSSNHTPDNDYTLLKSARTNRSSRKNSDAGSNYDSDYSSDGRSPRPLYTRDLLAWAFQIARGMEYLASRKVLHGDLAARNVLLAEDNVVKICDFGLARSIYKNDEYQKQGNCPLPVKWLAIECMTDRIFSTQSDVWSFGIVLWELFSLAKTPYPNVSPPSLLQWLLQGERLQKPAYADDRIYELMRSCWEQKPTKRPSFTELQTKLGTFLEDNVRNLYVHLDAVYTAMNTKKEGVEDYLARMTAPDYTNLVTPSLDHCVYDAERCFPPTPSQISEDEGYSQMSLATMQRIFHSEPPQGTKFEFDARKLTPTVTKANIYGSESTPMLTLSSLSGNGSESDQESHSPSCLSAYPCIEEESDEFFETKQNSKNMQPNSIKKHNNEEDDDETEFHQ